MLSTVEGITTIEPRILILEPDRKTRATVLRSAVKGWQGASVQTKGSLLSGVLGDVENLRSFDVILAGCNFTSDGSADNPTLKALRAIAADPNNPAVILLTESGSEYNTPNLGS